MYWQESKKRPVGLIVILVLVVFLAGMITMGALSGGEKAPPLYATGSNQAAGITGKAPASPEAPPGLGPETIADIVDAAGPAVVRIDTVVENRENLPPFFNDPFFRYFFGDEFRLPPQERRGLGSGFIISSDGYILTNEHVVNGAKEVKVTVVGFEQPFKAKVVGADYDLDLAVLKIEAGKPLPFLKLGDADKLRVGEWVIAIGNPGGLDHTVTVGVISAKGRPIQIEDRHYENLLQTDASINPGNSGGPLLNLKGEVIGINTAVNAAAQGIGFAIPSSTVQPVLNDLMTKGEITRPWLGVWLQDVTPEVADFLGLDKAEGALIYNIEPNSPAAKAGLKRGDVILKVDGQAVKSANDLVKLVQSRQVGQQIRLQFIRLGQKREVSVTLAAKPNRARK
ncbi:MAG: hypothetical protein PWP65_285 [Clostridia bacterium]|nr:hypothetical protein [Clostridia bacterium]